MNLSPEEIIIMYIPGLVFMGLGISAFFRKKPVRFWTGKKVYEEEITNIKAYNIAFGIMWIIFGVGLNICYTIDLFYFNSGIFPFLWCLLGIPVVIICYSKIIYKKYKNENYNVEDYINE